MSHREGYRELVPKGAYIISFTDLLSCPSKNAAARIAKNIYYKIGGSISTEAMKAGTEAHKKKELELNDNWVNELKLSYKMSDGFYLAGTIDRYHKDTKLIEDFKTTTSPASSYLKTNQVETYAFLAMNNDMVVEKGQYTTINKEGETIDQAPVPINAATAVSCYSTFILPRFNMIKSEIERLKNQYV